jgi:hypothetical protein
MDHNDRKSMYVHPFFIRNRWRISPKRNGSTVMCMIMMNKRTCKPPDARNHTHPLPQSPSHGHYTPYDSLPAAIFASFSKVGLPTASKLT